MWRHRITFLFYHRIIARAPRYTTLLTVAHSQRKTNWNLSCFASSQFTQLTQHQTSQTRSIICFDTNRGKQENEQFIRGAGELIIVSLFVFPKWAHLDWRTDRVRSWTLSLSLFFKLTNWWHRYRSIFYRNHVVVLMSHSATDGKERRKQLTSRLSRETVLADSSTPSYQYTLSTQEFLFSI